MTVLLYIMGICFFIFVVIAAPIWMLIYYLGQKHNRQNFSEQDIKRIEQLSKENQKIRERIATLESILDEEYPNWRDQ